jgi:hypothetical protein
MIKKILSFTLCGLLLIAVNAPFISAQTDANDSSTAKIKARIVKRGTGEKRRIQIIKRDRTKLKGYVSQINEDSFTLTDSKTGRNTVVDFAEVAEVKSGGSKTLILGVTFGAIIVAAVVVTAIFAKYCENEGGC